MSDAKSYHHSSEQPGDTPSQRWAQLRERMRSLIHAEVERLNPMDDARRALELIIESSVRPSEVDGHLKLTVIDEKGQPRMIEKNGHRTEFTLSDLLNELRATHPVLFHSSPRSDGDSRSTVSQAPRKQAGESSHQKQAQRDWLSLGPDSPGHQATSPEPVASQRFFHVRKGRTHFHGWSNAIAKAWRSSAARIDTAKSEALRDSFARSAERAQSLIHDVDEPPLSRRPGFALSIAVLAVLLALGVFAFLLRDPASQASIEGPTETGGISSNGSVTEQASPRPASSGRRLRGVPDVIDTATLSLEGEVVRLFGVEWAPGAGKPEDLTRYLQGREVICEPAGGNDTYRCKVGDQDLSRVILYNGGGQPTPEATPELRAAADKAREAKIGVWNK